MIIHLLNTCPLRHFLISNPIFFLLQNGDVPGGCHSNAARVPDAPPSHAPAAAGNAAAAAASPEHVRDRDDAAER